MISAAHKLAITGILQHKVPEAPTPTIVETSTGTGTYTGFSPTIATPALPIIVVSPSLGQGTYTGLAPTTEIITPFTLTFRSEQSTGIGDTPWRVKYLVYDDTLTLRYTATHDLNYVYLPSSRIITTVRTFSDFDPYYIDIQVQRRTESLGASPRDNRTNSSGDIGWYIDGVLQQTLVFILRERVNHFEAFTGFSSGTEFGVEIAEG